MLVYLVLVCGLILHSLISLGHGQSVNENSKMNRRQALKVAMSPKLSLSRDRIIESGRGNHIFLAFPVSKIVSF